MPFTFDLVWADPAEPAEEQQLFNQKKMFSENERGGNTVIFSRLALEEFFKKTGCSYIVRAHQRKGACLRELFARFCARLSMCAMLFVIV